MNIQNVVESTGLSKRMIRHYEEVGLLSPSRDLNNYRSYSNTDIERLHTIKSLRHLGFSLEDIRSLIEQKDVEEILKQHLQELLFKKREDYLEQQRSIDRIKRILRSNDTSSALWDQIAKISALPKTEDDGLERLLNRSKVVYGQIEELNKIAATVQFGPQKDFVIKETEFIKFGNLFDTVPATGASLISCDELYTHFALLTSDENLFRREFHEYVWAQFAKAWSEVSAVFAIHFETMTHNIAGLDHIFTPTDVCVRLIAHNDKKQEFSLIIPYPPLHTFLRRDKGVYLRE